MGLGMSVSAEHGDGRVAQAQGLRVGGLAGREDAGLQLLAGGAALAAVSVATTLSKTITMKINC